MASILKVDEMQGVTSAGDITVTDGAATFNMQSGLNKMWISYEGIANSIFDSFNIGSVTDNGTSEYTYNFSNNFNTAESYSSAMSVCAQSSPYMGSYTVHNLATTSSIKVFCARNSTGSMVDVANTTMNCCGDLV